MWVYFFIYLFQSVNEFCRVESTNQFYATWLLPDLADWSKKKKHCTVTTVDPYKGLTVVQTVSGGPATIQHLSGSTVEVNHEPIALFRYDQSLFAINEKCPHQGSTATLDTAYQKTPITFTIRITTRNL